MIPRFVKRLVLHCYVRLLKFMTSCIHTIKKGVKWDAGCKGTVNFMFHRVSD
jgi:hypothetical protein